MKQGTRVERNTCVVDRPVPPAAAEDIARATYELFEQRGNIHRKFADAAREGVVFYGFDRQDWFEAERLVRARRRRRGG